MSDVAPSASLPRFREDLWLWLPMLILIGLGFTMIYSASSEKAFKAFHTEYFYLLRQMRYAGIGICVMAMARFFPYRLLAGLAYPILFAACALLGAVLVTSYGHTAGGALRWLKLGPLTFQPAEFAKYALIIYMAYSLNRKHEQIKVFSIGFVPHVVVLGIFAILLLAQPDFGSLLILIMISWMMMFVGGVSLLHLLLPSLVVVPGLIWVMLSESYRVSRLTSFLDPWADQLGAGYQVCRSLMAFGNGGLFGKGLGNGRMKLDYIPESHTDFIFSVLGEEVGLMGVVLVLALFAVLFWRGVAIGIGAKDRFGGYLAIGISMALGLQVIINTGVTLSLLPPKGLTLPFLSYGGTSLVMNMAALGILMNIGAGRGRER